MILRSAVVSTEVANSDAAWHRVCALDRLRPERGIAAIVDQVTVAIFLLPDGSVHAVDHIDPATNTPTIARGLLGTADGRPYVAAPLYKQRYELATGRCLDDPNLALAVWPCRIADGSVLIASPTAPTVHID